LERGRYRLLLDVAFDEGQGPEPYGCEQEIKKPGAMDDLIDGDDVGHIFLLAAAAETLSRIRHVVHDNYAPGGSYDANMGSVPLIRWRRNLWHGDEGGHGFDAVPEFLEAEVFVGGVSGQRFA
jgi:hypothetical protein